MQLHLFNHLLTKHNYSANATSELSGLRNKARIARKGDCECLLAVSTIECKSKKASAPNSDRNVPELFLIESTT